MSSIRKIAKQAGVSPATASRALKLHPDVSPETRRRVVQAANSVGYTTHTPGPSDSAVGVWVDSHRHLALYDCLWLNGVRRALHEAKLDVRFVDATRDKAADESYTAFFRRRGVKAVVMPPGSNERRVCESVVEEGFPSIVIGEHFGESPLHYACCDSSDASRRAVQHLIELGHRRIAIALPPFSDHDHEARYRGYAAGLEANGLPMDESLVVRVSPALEGGYAALNDLLSRREPPTAIFFADPYPAIGALARAGQIGLSVPGQLSIVGVDDGRMRRQVFPMLTAVVQPTDELGYVAGRALIELLNGGADGYFREVLPATLEINQTSGTPHGTAVRVQPNGALLAG